MIVEYNSNGCNIVLNVLEGPLPDSEGALYFVMEAEQTRFRITILPTRAIGTPSDISSQLEVLGTRFVSEFTKKNRLLLHRMIKKGQQAAISSGGEVLPPATITDPPVVGDSGQLIFKGVVGQDHVTIELAQDLEPLRIRLPGGQPCSELVFFAAYDAALDYIEDNRSAVAELGFDTSVLDSKSQDPSWA